MTDIENGEFAGIGLMVDENGRLILTVLDGGTDSLLAFHVSDVELRNLSAMIDAVVE